MPINIIFVLFFLLPIQVSEVDPPPFFCFPPHHAKQWMSKVCWYEWNPPPPFPNKILYYSSHLPDSLVMGVYTHQTLKGSLYSTLNFIPSRLVMGNLYPPVVKRYLAVPLPDSLEVRIYTHQALKGSLFTVNDYLTA